MLKLLGNTEDVLVSIDLADHLASGVVGGVRLSQLLQAQARPIDLENNRLYTPLWDEAFVDVQAIVTADVYRALAETPKWMFRETKPCAFAVNAEHGGLILVSEGLLHLIAFCAYHAGIASLMAAGGAGEQHLTDFEDTFLHIITNHVEHGWPLPEAIEVSSASAYQHIIVHRDCMTVLVLLHELGHIRLGHLGATVVGSIDFQPRVEDLASELHLAEIQADAFAFRAFANPDALNVATTLFTAWAYAEACRRLMRGPSAHLSITHPLSINRLNHLVRHLSQMGQQSPVSGVTGLVARTAALVKSPSDAGISVAAFSYEDGIARHHQLLDAHQQSAQPFAEA